MSKKTMYKTFGSKLCRIGHSFLRDAMNVKKTEVKAQQMRDFIKDKTDIDPTLYDMSFKVTDIKTIKDIIEHDWTDEKEYVSEYYDCDNFANTFAARLAEIYGLNTAGRYSVEIRKPDTEERIGFHRANIVVTMEKDGLKAWLYEPMKDGLVEIQKGELPVIGDWQYKPHMISFN